MKLKISEKITKDVTSKKVKVDFDDVIKKVKTEISPYSNGNNHNNGSIFFSKWNYIFPAMFFLVIVIFVVISLVDLQIINGKTNYKKTENNRVEVEEVSAYRGIIMDRNGVKVAENVPSINVYIDLGTFRNNGKIDREGILRSVKNLDVVLDDKYWKTEKDEYASLEAKISKYLDSMSEYEYRYNKNIVVAKGIDNDSAISIRSKTDTLKGVYIDNGNKRFYPLGNVLTPVLGYTGDVYAEEMKALDYVDFNDVIGKSGVEKEYDRSLIGSDGYITREIDVLGQRIDGGAIEEKPSVSGKNLYLTIDSVAQKKMYELLRQGVKQYRATGGAAILEDVSTGEILSLVSYPTFDNNLFIGGISSKDFDGLLKSKGTPLTNKAIGAQVPPGSTFKTLVASAALDSKAIDLSTRYVSRSNYTFSNGAPFQEYHDHAYGSVNVVDALSVSSNIFFCETIRHWDMNKLIPYLKNFGIGQYTGIDIPGEGPGMLPSPENKAVLAKTTSPWLDPIWYPEGDSCNSVIGQGITTVTPIQMVNWISAIANGGTLLTPHVGQKLVGTDGSEEVLNFPPIRKDFVKSNALSTVRYGMWSAVNGPRRSISWLAGGKTVVAAKTGTAEFGKVDRRGVYEHTHAWVTGFFPYDKPKYAFVIFLEDGGESYNAAKVARQFIDWYMVKK